VFTLLIGGLLGAAAVGVGLGVPVLGIVRDHEAGVRRELQKYLGPLEAQLADQAHTIEAYRELVSYDQEFSLANK